MVGHNHKENELRVAHGAAGVADRRRDLLIVVVLDRLGERFKQHFFVEGSFVRDWADVGVLDGDAEAFLGRQVVEFVVDVVGVDDVSLQAEDGEVFEHAGFVHHRVQVVRIVQHARVLAIGLLALAGGARLRPTRVLLVAAGGLRGEVRRLEDAWTLEHLGLDGVGVQRNVEAPLLHVLRLRNHVVQLTNRTNTVVRLLEQRLAHGCHRLLVLADLLRNAHKHAQLGWQVDVLALLLDFKQGLVETHDLLVVLLAEVLHHGDGLTSFTLLKARGLRAHVPPDTRYLVGLVVAVTSHHNGVFKFVVHCLLGLKDLWWLAGVALSLLVKAHHLLIDKLEAVVNGQVFRDVVDDQVDSALEDPRARKEAGPRLNGLIEDLGLRWHEETRVPADLAELGVAHLGLDDRVDEREREGVLFHLHGVEVVEGELGDARNADDKLAAEVGLLRLEVDRLVDLLRTEDVVAH